MAKRYHTVSSTQPLSGGREMITERRIPCTSGCTYCKSDRKPGRVSDLDFSQPSGRVGSPSTLNDRLPTPYHFDFKPTPRSDKERRRERRSSERDHYYYSDGGRAEDHSLRRSNSLHGPSQPIPIPPRRSTTMHEDDRWRESRDRPRVVQRGHSRRESDDVPLGFYDLLYNHGAGSSRYGDRDRYAAKDSRHAEPSRTRSHRRRSESPMEVRYKDDDYYRERSSLRRKPKIVQQEDNQPAIIYGSSPLAGSFESSSYGSLRPSTSHGISQSPPKSVRWGDDPRTAQNAKISNRAPKLSRSATISGAGTGSRSAGDVKSILKKSDEEQHHAGSRAKSEAPAVQALSRDQYDALYRSAAGIGAEDRATGPQHRAKEERAAREALELDSAGMIEGLRKRMNGSRAAAAAAPLAGSSGETGRDRRYSFDMPPRRFSGTASYGEKASSKGRRSEMFYDDGRRDWY